jgi:hypothetical protein
MHTALVFFAGLFVGYGIACLMGCSEKDDDGVRDLARQDAPKKLVWLYPK